jgi:type II secretory pathway component PulF
MVETGEEGGHLSEMLRRSAEYHENDAEAVIARAAVLIPVIIYLAVAAYIGVAIVRAWSGLMSRRLGGL